MIQSQVNAVIPIFFLYFYVKQARQILSDMYFHYSQITISDKFSHILYSKQNLNLKILNLDM